MVLRTSRGGGVAFRSFVLSRSEPLGRVTTLFILYLFTVLKIRLIFSFCVLCPAMGLFIRYSGCADITFLRSKLSEDAEPFSLEWRKTSVAVKEMV